VPAGATVVLVLGSDCYPRAMADRRLAHLLATDPVPVPEMAPSELRRAIEAPATAACLELAAGLADAIVDDVRGEHSAIALVSHALLALWERREGTRLTRAAYRELGGVQTVAARLAQGTRRSHPSRGCGVDRDCGGGTGGAREVRCHNVRGWSRWHRPRSHDDFHRRRQQGEERPFVDVMSTTCLPELSSRTTARC
jgi:hypothetical protein